MPENTYETVLFDVFLANQARQQLIAAALEGTQLPPEEKDAIVEYMKKF